VVGEAATVPTMTRARSGIPTEAGEVSAEAGVIHSESQMGLTPSCLGRDLFFVGSRALENIPETIQPIALAVSGVLRARLRIFIIWLVPVAIP